MAGFLRIGLHPGGGFFVLSGRTAGREATAALGLFGDELSGRRAADLGIAWEALPDADVEARAKELAARAGADPDLARRAARSFRSELGPPAATWGLALDAERAAQMWSLRRRP
jgi:enoyl-CoA hydratase